MRTKDLSTKTLRARDYVPGTPAPDYLANIRHAKTPQVAALWIRAFATHYVGGCMKFGQYTADDCLSIIVEAERCAWLLEHEPSSNWRGRLKEWGYV